MNLIFVALFAVASLIDSGDAIEEATTRSVIDKIVSAECDEMVFVMVGPQDARTPKLDDDDIPVMKWPGAFCGWQATDIGVANGWSAHARVQISIGCEGVTDLSTAQETEFWYRVNIEDGTLLAKDHIELSPHLIRSGTWVPEFFDPQCAERAAEREKKQEEERIKQWESQQTI